MAGRERMQYEAYLRERAFLARASLETRRGLDRSLLTLSSGAIALSMVFLDRVGSDPIVALWLIASSWTLFAACIVTVLWSHWTSIRAFRSALEMYEETLRSGEPSDQVSGFAKATTFLNGLSMIMFALGVIVFLVFALMNRGSVNGS